MKLRKLLIVSVILLFISGYSDFKMICSLNPFYLDKNKENEGYFTTLEIKTKEDSFAKSLQLLS
jgi:hypothetical protein